MSLLIFVLAGASIGFVIATYIKESKDAKIKREVLDSAKAQLLNMNKTRAKEKEVAYHAGFEAGMEKARKDIDAEIDALSIAIANENHVHGPDCGHVEVDNKPRKRKPASKSKPTKTTKPKAKQAPRSKK